MMVTMQSFRGEEKLNEEVIGITNTTEQAIEAVMNGGREIALEDFIIKVSPELAEGEVNQYEAKIYAILDATDIRFEFHINRVSLPEILNRIIGLSTENSIAKYFAKY